MLLKSNLACLFVAGNGRNIVPGNNIIPDEEGKELLEKKYMQVKIKAGLFTIVKEEVEEDIVENVVKTDESDEVKAATIISNHSIEDAIDIVEDLLDIKVLRSLLEIDTRPEVLKSVKEAIKAIEEDTEGF